MDNMDKKELEEILGKFAKNTDYKLEIIADDISSIKENVSHLTDRVDQLDGKVDQLGVKVDGLTVRVDNLTEKVDLIFEQTGALTVDREIVKGSIQHHEQKIKQL